MSILDKNQRMKLFIKEKYNFFIMEEIEQVNKNNIALQNQKTLINAHEIIKKFRAIKDRQLFC